MVASQNRHLRTELGAAKNHLLSFFFWPTSLTLSEVLSPLLILFRSTSGRAYSQCLSVSAAVKYLE